MIILYIGDNGGGVAMTESDAFKELLDALCRIETAILGLSSNVNRVGDELKEMNDASVITHNNLKEIDASITSAKISFNNLADSMIDGIRRQ